MGPQKCLTSCLCDLSEVSGSSLLGKSLSQKVMQSGRACLEHFITWWEILQSSNTPRSCPSSPFRYSFKSPLAKYSVMIIRGSSIDTIARSFKIFGWLRSFMRLASNKNFSGFMDSGFMVLMATFRYLIPIFHVPWCTWMMDNYSKMIHSINLNYDVSITTWPYSFEIVKDP